MKTLKISAVILGSVLMSSFAYAELSAELSCKAKAKEIAVETYSSCITEARNSQIDQIRKSYKEDLANLKSKYDKELKKLNSKIAKKTKSSPTVTEVSSFKNIPGTTKKLPVKMHNSETVITQNLVDSPVIVPTENPISPLEKEALDADKTTSEVIDMANPEEAPAT